MNVPEKWAKGTVRFSIGRMTTIEEIHKAGEVVIQAVKQMHQPDL
jgi:cysteine desulfurase